MNQDYPSERKHGLLFLPSSSSLAPLHPFRTLPPPLSALFVFISPSVGSGNTAAVGFTQTRGVVQLAHRAGLPSVGNVHTVLHSGCTKGGCCSLIKAILTEVWCAFTVYIFLKAKDMGHFFFKHFLQMSVKSVVPLWTGDIVTFWCLIYRFPNKPHY